MSLVQKISPVGIDRQVDKIQVALFNDLAWDSIAGVTYDSFPRA